MTYHLFYWPCDSSNSGAMFHVPVMRAYGIARSLWLMGYEVAFTSLTSGIIRFPSVDGEED